jgi:hypothetical protein
MIKLFQKLPLSKIALSLLLFAFASAYIKYKPYQSPHVLNWDMAIYYHYLPATFIYEDFTLMEAHDIKEQTHFYLNMLPDDKAVSKMTSGWAILNLPAFLIADTWAKNSSYKRNGISHPYLMLVTLNALLFLFIGLYYLRRFLSFFFKDYAVAFALGFIVVGTNLPYYTLFEPMAHVYGFSLFSTLLYYTWRYINHPSFTKVILMGLVGGLLVLLRPTNLMLLLFPLSLYAFALYQKKLRFSFKDTLLFIPCFLLVFIPQFLYWHYMTHQWIIYSYTDESFHFTNAEVWKGLFGYRKGWLIYSPIVAFGLVGLLWAAFKKQASALFALGTIALFVFVTFSWWCWWYGGGFGSRATIELLPLIAMGLGFLLHSMAKSFSNYVQVPVYGLLGACMLLSLFYHFQYRKGLIHYESMTKEAFHAVFLKREFPVGFQEMIERPPYEAARKNLD